MCPGYSWCRISRFLNFAECTSDRLWKIRDLPDLSGANPPELAAHGVEVAKWQYRRALEKGQGNEP